MTVTCPLCQFPFEEQDACARCGLVKSCALLRCPNCQYEFVEKSGTISWIGRGIQKLRGFLQRPKTERGKK